MVREWRLSEKNDILQFSFVLFFLSGMDYTPTVFSVTQFYPERETVNLFRAGMLISTISLNLFRDIVCRFVNPKSLHSEKDSILTPQTEEEEIKESPNFAGIDWSSTENDLLFCYNLLRNNCGIIQHKNGWGFLPDINDHTLAACIDRIMIQRNVIASHMKSSLSETFFKEICQKLRQDIINIEQVVIGGYLYAHLVDDVLSMTINQLIAVEYVGKRKHVSYLGYYDH